MNKLICALSAFGFLALSTFSGVSAELALPASPTLTDYAQGEKYLYEISQRLPLAARRVSFVTRKAISYGDWEPRPQNVFAPGEPILSYLEPVGFTYRPVGGDKVAMAITVDLEVTTQGGKILGGQKAIKKIEFVTRTPANELFFNLTLNLSGVAPGGYTVAYLMHDDISGKVARVEQPFIVRAND